MSVDALLAARETALLQKLRELERQHKEQAEPIIKELRELAANRMLGRMG